MSIVQVAAQVVLTFETRPTHFTLAAVAEIGIFFYINKLII